MAEPSFNGANIFGPAPLSTRAEPPNARQFNAYPGVAGVEAIDLGPRTSTTEFVGLWVADSEADLAAFLGDMLALKRSGIMATLVDTKGIASVDAILDSWRLLGATVPADDGSCSVEYQMTFLHLGIVPLQSSSGTGTGTSTGTGTTSDGTSTTSSGT